jgi:hypothetical protein
MFFQDVNDNVIETGTSEVAARYSAESGFRTTRTQHLLVRGVKDTDVPLVT